MNRAGTIAMASADGPADRPSRARLVAWTCLAILLVLAFVSFLDRQIISLMVGIIKADLGISDTQIGVLQGAAFGLVYPLFAIPLGYAADCWSRRWVIFLGVLFWSVAAMLSGLTDSFDTLLAARIGVGIGEAALGPAAASLLSDMFPRRRLALVFSIFSCGSLLGSAGALAIGGAVINWAGDGFTVPALGHLAAWQVAFIVTGLPGGLLAFLIFLVPEPKRPLLVGPTTKHAPWSEVFAFMRQTWVFLLCQILGFTFLLLVAMAVVVWLPVIMERVYGWSIVKVGAILGALIAITGLSGQLANGLMVDGLMSKGVDDAHVRYYAFTTILVAFCGVGAPFAPNVVLYLAFFVPIKFLLNFAGVSSAALLVVTPSRLRGRMAAMAGTVSSVLGGTFGPSTVAFFTDHVFKDEAKVAYSLALTFAIFIPLAGIMFALALKPMRQAITRQRALDTLEGREH